MNLITLLLSASRREVLMALAMGIISGACSALIIAMVNLGLASSVIASTTLYRFIALVALALFSRFTAELLLIRLSQRVIYQLRLGLSRQILAAPLSQLEALGSAPLLTTLTDDVQTISNAVAYIPSACIAIAIVLGCLTYLATLSLPLFFGFTGFLVMAVVSYQLVTHRAKASLSLARRQQEQLFSQLTALTSGLQELKQNRDRAASFLVTALQPTLQQFRQHNAAGMTLFSLGLSWVQLLLFTAIGLVSFVLPPLLSLAPTVTAGYTLTLIFLIIPLDALTTIFPRLSKANIALQNTQALQIKLSSHHSSSHSLSQHSDLGPNGTLQNSTLANSPANRPAKQAIDPYAWETLVLQGVEYAHPGSISDSSAIQATAFNLGPITLTIHRQELLFLTGGNGSGKSTFAKLLTGLYRPTSGTIQLDDQPITDSNRDAYRQQFSTVFYDFYLFEQLFGLIDYTNPIAQQTQINRYLDQLQLTDKVQIQQGKFSTLALSQGQRRRLALLVSYLENRAFYVFDEWAADQDPEFRDLFYTQLLPNLQQQGKTILVITHDDRYFHLADRVLKLDYGRFVTAAESR